ncbi:hypothetical protein DEJ04_14215 [Curtobacterium sp. MCLR17_044]|nr:hypothetical protein DEJ04_14215 [Curtobacterium sp. MCLR17_044]
MDDGTKFFTFALWGAVAFKFVWDGLHGGASLYRPNRYPQWRLLARPRHVQVSLSPRAWRIWYWARWVSLALIAADTAGGGPWVILALTLFHEIVLDKKFHTQLLFICCLWAALFEASIWSGIAGQSEAFVGAVSLVAVVTPVYWNSAYIKFKSPGYLSGEALRVALLGFSVEGPRAGVHEFLFGVRPPEPFLARIGVRWAFRWGSRIAAGLEVLLPLMLLTPATFFFGAVLGVCLHFAFWALLPGKLLPFQLVMLSSYAAFESTGHAVWSW